MHNRAFYRALHSLPHPVTLVAVVLLLLNDHLLRWVSPSWWTGKLGDFVWLIFAPFILALVVALFVPPRLRQQERIVGIFSIGFIGLWFASAKTTPAVHTLTVSVLDSITGWPGSLRLDPTDLLTLPALGISWLIWQQASYERVRLSPRMWVVAALGLMTTLATSCPVPDLGVTIICQKDDMLVTYAGPLGGNHFFSEDGGLIWKKANVSGDRTNCLQDNSTSYRSSNEAWLLRERHQTYRLVPAVGIYSYDSHNLENLEIDLTEIGGDARRYYYEGYNPGFPCGGPRVFLPGPLDALVDTKTGNLVVAMGLDGILTRTTDGEWH